MKKNSDAELECALNAISDLKKVNAPDYFHTKLMLRMENEIMSKDDELPTKSVYIIYAISLFLFVAILLTKNFSTADSKYKSNIESLASSYDQYVSN